MLVSLPGGLWSRGPTDVGFCAAVAPVVFAVSTLSPVWQNQYRRDPQAEEGIRETIAGLKASGVLEYSQSSWNTPILPVEKVAGGDPNAGGLRTAYAIVEQNMQGQLEVKETEEMEGKQSAQGAELRAVVGTTGKSSEHPVETLTTSWVYLKSLKQKWAEPRWTGPYEVTERTSHALRLRGKGATWFHLSQCAPAHCEEAAQDDD
ncbi:uncharacterized protein [Syngnathus scovelli]|uniref:uncharacterized protein n=1 Tax=Syngnathus scovelli TaxID=161590 RepID=UPI002110269D|nr:uncharacterized protein LOC125970621 [Syngnathus scovelli]